MYHSLHNTHNVLEILPHWVDSPWRPASNINMTGLPEPPPKETGNKLHLANQYYATDNPALRELHRNFILHELDELGSEPNVIFTPAFQFVGPLAFQQFFQDTVAQWEKAHKKQVKLALIATKDITDAILNDPVRSKQIAVVDMRYWQYRPDGSLFAPAGGLNLAFRELVAKSFKAGGDSPPGTSPDQAYRQVREYRDKYPHVAIVAWHNGAGPLPALMAGAAQVLLSNPSGGHGQGLAVDKHPTDVWVRGELGHVLMTMSPRDRVVSGASGSAWCLADEKMRYLLLYSTAGASMTLDVDLPAKGYAGTWVHPATGRTQPLGAPAQWTKGTRIPKPDGNAWMLALRGS
jgi:Family of unknown function (DUF6298)